MYWHQIVKDSGAFGQQQTFLTPLPRVTSRTDASKTIIADIFTTPLIANARWTLVTSVITGPSRVTRPASTNKSPVSSDLCARAAVLARPCLTDFTIIQTHAFNRITWNLFKEVFKGLCHAIFSFLKSYKVSAYQLNSKNSFSFFFHKSCNKSSWLVFPDEISLNSSSLFYRSILCMGKDLQ